MSNENNLDAAMSKEFETMKLVREKNTGAKNEEPSQAQVIVRTTEEQRERWKAAALKSGMSMSEWIRDLCMKEAANVLECQHPENMIRRYPWRITCMKCGQDLPSKGKNA